MRLNLRLCCYISLGLFMVAALKLLYKRDDVLIFNNIVFRSAKESRLIQKNGCVHTLRGKIPKIIHQTWNDEIVPTEFVESVKSLVRDNPYPEWQYFWWTTQTMIQLVHDKYPHLLGIVNSTGTTSLHRSDILRYVLMHEFGGAYFDLDTKSVRTLSSFVDNHECALSLEPREHLFTHKTNFLLTNSVMLCEPRNPFFKQMLELIRMTPNCKVAFICTGPPVITRAYADMKEKTCESFKLPEVLSSDFFQDVYDIEFQTNVMEENCIHNERLKNFQINICEAWKKRGKENRTLSKHAYTYHTWYHIGLRNVTLDPKNHILNIIPTAKLYGRHFLSTSSDRTYYFI